MFRLVHTADWQVGMMARGLGRAAGRVREARLASLSRVLALAREREASALLVAGDLFEHNQVDGLLVERVAGLLNDETRTPIYIIPGNHDPLSPDSVYHRRVWSQMRDHVHLLTSATPLSLAPQVTLLPCPLHHRSGSEDPTAWIPPRQAADELRIGLAHGTWRLRDDLGDDAHPIPRDVCQLRDLDYMALGHWHSTLPDPVSAPEARAFYSGTHEQTRFGERDSGNVLLVTLHTSGQAPEVERVRIGRLRWLELVLDLDQRPLSGWIRELRQWPDPGNTLLQLKARGASDIEVACGLRELEELLAGRFLHHDLDLSGLGPEVSSPELERILTAPHLRAAAAELEQMARGEAKDEVEPAVAREALRLLLQMASGADRRGLAGEGDK